MGNTLAVLMTCHNRKEKTLACLKSLYANTQCHFDVFLVDDGSTDQTSIAVKDKFPEVNIILGNGHLYWNGGMRLAWLKASEYKNYDFYLWLNDDVVLYTDAISHMFKCYLETKEHYNKASIIVGTFSSSNTNKEFSYGGRNENTELVPNGKVQKCKYINGNAVLVSKKIFNELGFLSEEYTHSIGDFDYGLRASLIGIENYTTKKYIGVCEPNGIADWQNYKVKFKNRIKNFHSPNGLNYKEYIFFRKKFWGYQWVFFGIKAYLRMLSPKLYSLIKDK